MRLTSLRSAALLLGALRRGVASFNAEGTGTALATVAALATLGLVLPTFTTSEPGPEFSPAQLAFAATASPELTPGAGAPVMEGVVRARPEGTVNAELATGEIRQLTDDPWNDRGATWKRTTVAGDGCAVHMVPPPSPTTTRGRARSPST